MNRGWMVLVCLVLFSCERARSETAEHQPLAAKSFRVSRGEVELRGRVRAVDDRDVNADVVLDVRSVKRNAEVQYRIPLWAALDSDEALELCVRGRRMYALFPRGNKSWRSVLESSIALESLLEVVRLDGAGEED